LAIAPEYFPTIRDNDTEFSKTDYFAKMKWLKDEIDDLYDPKYTDMLRVSFGLEFQRGKLADLVSLLSGRNFETRTFEEEIAKSSFAKLKNGVMKFMNETSFKRFVMIIKSAGFVIPNMIRSMNAINFAYMLYLILRDKKEDPAKIESYVKRWFVMSILTGRSSGSFESQFDFDIKQIGARDFGEYLAEVEAAQLSDAFWEAGLLQSLNTPVASSPFFYVYLASQTVAGDKGFLSKDIKVGDLIVHRGDIHHIFPKNYLKKHGLKRSKYNQIANYVYMQSEINIKVGDKSPKDYFGQIKEQCNGGEMKFGGINNMQALSDNLRMNCIPESVFNLVEEDYENFLTERRKLMAEKIRKYYQSL